MKKKLIAFIVCLVMVMMPMLAACGGGGGGGEEPAADAMKVGLICLHDENSTYDLNFITAAKAACENLGISEENYLIRTNIPEGQECYDAAADLVDAGCDDTVLKADT